MIVVSFGCLLWLVGYPAWARRLIYSESNVKTKYPRFGEIVERIEAKILASPKGEVFLFLAWHGCI